MTCAFLADGGEGVDLVEGVRAVDGINGSSRHRPRNDNLEFRLKDEHGSSCLFLPFLCLRA